MKPTHIILHHSLTKDGSSVSWDAIRRYHLSKKYDDIGYHYGVELVNDRYEIFVGRTMNQDGAHCIQSSMNHRSLGVILVGDFDNRPPPDDQWNLGVKLVSSLIDIFDIPPENVRAHRNYATYKTCPGRCFDMGRFRAEVRVL